MLLVFASALASSQPLSVTAMQGECKNNSQLSKFTADEWKNKTGKPRRYSCNSAVISELPNGKVTVHFSQKGSVGSVVVGYAGVYADRFKNRIAIDGLYFNGPGFDNSRMDAKGRCEIEVGAGKISNLSCIAGTGTNDGGTIVSSAIFQVSDIRVEGDPSLSQSQQPSKPVREPWFGPAQSGNRCVPTDMSPADRIEWLRRQGIRYDAIDYAGPEVNGRVPKVTIIPKGVNLPNWVYYATKAFCEEKETSIDKYR